MQFYNDTGAFQNVNAGAAVLFEARTACNVRTSVNTGPAFSFAPGDKWLVPAGVALFVQGACVVGQLS
jgi:uncharacterized protein YjlB